MNDQIKAQAYDSWIESDLQQRNPDPVPPPDLLLLEELNSGVVE